MKLFQLKSVAAAAAVSLTLLSPLARADDAYAGISLGAPHFGQNVNGLSGNDHGVAGKVYGGYQLSPNFALEAGLASLGRLKGDTGSVGAHGEFIDLVGRLPLGHDVSLLGSVGAAHVRFSSPDGDDAGGGVKLGLGAEYALSPSATLRAEYERYRTAAFDEHPEVGQMTVGLRFGF